MSRTKRVALVAAHFVPSNLASVHRSRLWSLYLREFGWEPIIVTTHWDYYEERIEPDLVQLLPKDLQVIRTKALSTRPLRLVGDIGIRGFLWHYRALYHLARSNKIDFVQITIPSNFSALLGPLTKRTTGVPYGIDYIDPWVHQFAGSDQPFTKAWASAQLADLLEPWAVGDASLITGINQHYYQGVLERNPQLAGQAVFAEMPYGGSEVDHDYVRLHPRKAQLFERHADKFNMIYAGAMLPKAYEILDRFFESLVLMKNRRPQIAEMFHLHFVGTGTSTDDPHGYNIKPLIERHSLQDCVSEHPQRLPYLDVLNHLHASSGVLVLGSTEPHYSPSKIFQAIMSRRAVLALLNKNSTAVDVLRQSRAGLLVTFSENALPDAGWLASELESFVFSSSYSEDKVNWGALANYSARESAKTLACALDEALARSQHAKQRVCESES